MPAQPWLLAEANYAEVKAQRYEAAVLPLGATEPHNLHLPYGTDIFEAEVVGRHICQAAWNRGARVVLLPTIPYGTQSNQRELPLAMNLQPSTLWIVIRDLVESLSGAGIRKVLLLNSHGGNDLKPLLRELYGRSGVQLFLCNWYQVIQDVQHQIFADAGDHAGELETAFALAYFPHLVAHRADGSLAADEGATARSRFEAVNQGWVQITRPWHLLTTNTGAGNPHPARAEQGRQVVDLLVERLGQFLVELAASPLDERFPFA